MHLSKALAAKLAAAVLVVSALVTPTLAANVAAAVRGIQAKPPHPALCTRVRRFGGICPE